MKQSLLRSARLTSARRSPSERHYYHTSPSVPPARTSPEAQSTQGQASPGTASNVAPADPVGASADEQRVRGQRTTKGGAASPDSASVAQPVSDPGGSGVGRREEEEHGGAARALKQGPGKSGGGGRVGEEASGCCG
ncbi:hypothetical protein F5Y05DRAFT_417049 [Hypoxylon sp. FL0543]|nr:hypothetical protein F5Y05DRAFT_417049 [Hypoxylon sp. FL0543]